MTPHATTAGRLVCLTALAAAVLSLAPVPASADSASFTDGTGTPGSLDIHRVKVVNEERVKIRVVVADLRRQAGQGQASAWLDTDPDRSGPEFFIGSGLWDSDWAISRARDWKVVGNGPLSCPVDQRLLFERDTIVWITGPKCLGDYGKVRVSVTTRGGGNTDHSPAHHEFHPWVARY